MPLEGFEPPVSGGELPQSYALDRAAAGIGKTVHTMTYRGADKSLARPGRKQATATEDFEFHLSYL